MLTVKLGTTSRLLKHLCTRHPVSAPHRLTISSSLGMSYKKNTYFWTKNLCPHTIKQTTWMDSKLIKPSLLLFWFLITILVIASLVHYACSISKWCICCVLNYIALAFIHTAPSSTEPFSVKFNCLCRLVLWLKQLSHFASHRVSDMTLLITCVAGDGVILPQWTELHVLVSVRVIADGVCVWLDPCLYKFVIIFPSDVIYTTLSHQHMPERLISFSPTPVCAVCMCGWRTAMGRAV